MTQGFSPGMQLPRIEAGLSRPSSAEFKNGKIRTSTFPHAFIASALPYIYNFTYLYNTLVETNRTQCVIVRPSQSSAPTLCRTRRHPNSVSVAKIRKRRLPSLCTGSTLFSDRSNLYFQFEHLGRNSKETQAVRVSLNSTLAQFIFVS